MDDKRQPGLFDGLGEGVEPDDGAHSSFDAQASFAAAASFAAVLDDAEYHSGASFEGLDLGAFRLSGHTFEDCTFTSCRFDDRPQAGVSFISTEFRRCELVLTKLAGVTLNGVLFADCKLVGVHFSECNKFGFAPAFEGCLIDQSVFQKHTWKKGRFVKSLIRSCDFMECGLREAVFDESTFENTRFSQCDLVRADFRTAAGYTIDPSGNRISKARFSLPEAQSFLVFLGIRLD
ncbi:MAG: pentapeptide repeat-containing protein [Deltaproteobacteria bacterium HGW-Deltaproteobacteria-22]|jgi:uncharacterized protein YjbI with pentapeptide repeats|nr:MAG: pentapeptide repeat-containing protein [Deltaproteobacteria bacterium HGW-Deltaproteobacteria-22]